jgi:hypothetical protein
VGTGGNGGTGGVGIGGGPTGPGTSGSGSGVGGGPTVTAPGPTITASGTADLSCPVNNGETYTGNMGMQYILLCDTGFSDATLETQTQDLITSCISACDMYNTLKFYMGSQCLGINYYPAKAQDNCLLKAGSTSVRQSGTISGRLLTPQGGGGNGTGPGSGPGDYGSTIVGSMSASPVFTEGPVRTETETTTTTTTSLVPTTILSISTVYSGGSSVSEVTRTSISYTPASTQTQTTTTTTTSLVPTTIYLTSTSVSTYISQGTPYITSIPITSAIISYGPPPTQTVTTTTTQISYVPSTIYEIRTTVSTFVSNGISYVTSYGISTAVSVSYIPASTNTVTTTLVSISISERTVSGATITTAIPNTNPNTFGPPGSNTYGPPGPGGGTVTITETPTGANTHGPGGTFGPGGPEVVTITQGGGQYITVTLGGGSDGATATTTVYITRTVAPSSRSSSFTCRTYATNYSNAGSGAAPTGSFKRAAERAADGIDGVKKRRRSIFDAEVVIGKNREETGRSGEAPALWYHGIEDGKGFLEG